MSVCLSGYLSVCLLCCFYPAAPSWLSFTQRYPSASVYLALILLQVLLLPAFLTLPCIPCHTHTHSQIALLQLSPCLPTLLRRANYSTNRFFFDCYITRIQQLQLQHPPPLPPPPLLLLPPPPFHLAVHKLSDVLRRSHIHSPSPSPSLTRTRD